VATVVLGTWIKVQLVLKVWPYNMLFTAVWIGLNVLLLVIYFRGVARRMKYVRRANTRRGPRE